MVLSTVSSPDPAVNVMVTPELSVMSVMVRSLNWIALLTRGQVDEVVADVEVCDRVVAGAVPEHERVIALATR